MAHSRADYCNARIITVIRLNAPSVCLLGLKLFSVHDHSCLDPLLILNIEQIKVVQVDFTLGVVASVDKKKGSKCSSYVSHSLFWRDTRPLKFCPQTPRRLKHPNVVKTRHHV